jgi:hypothetical protein
MRTFTRDNNDKIWKDYLSNSCLAYDVRAMRVLSNHFRFLGWDTSGSSKQWTMEGTRMTTGSSIERDKLWNLLSFRRWIPFTGCKFEFHSSICIPLQFARGFCAASDIEVVRKWVRSTWNKNTQELYCDHIFVPFNKPIWVALLQE